VKQKSYYKKVKISKFEINWNLNYSQLVRFKRKFGHCNVPQHWKTNIELGRWVIRQRARKGNLTTKRIKRLNKIGFVWNTFEHSWENYFSKLIEFKNRNGHCYVSKSDQKNLKLADWVNKQRRDKKQKYRRLNIQKIKRLNEIGFNWGISRPGWERQYQDLLYFRQQYGHCKVPQLWKQNPTLGNWVNLQRYNLSKNKLSKARYNKLSKIGFTWSIKPRKNEP
jgi:hypothetical protein